RDPGCQEATAALAPKGRHGERRRPDQEDPENAELRHERVGDRSSAAAGAVRDRGDAWIGFGRRRRIRAFRGDRVADEDDPRWVLDRDHDRGVRALDAADRTEGVADPDPGERVERRAAEDDAPDRCAVVEIKAIRGDGRDEAADAHLTTN